MHTDERPTFESSPLIRPRVTLSASNHFILALKVVGYAILGYLMILLAAFLIGFVMTIVLSVFGSV